MGKLIRKLAYLIYCAMFFGCGPMPDPRAIFAGDLQSPKFLGAASVSSSSIAVTFHEPVDASPNGFDLLPNVGIEEIRKSGSSIILDLSNQTEPGSEYVLSGAVADSSGNTLKFTTKVFGFNPRVPSLLINEFTTQGSGNHPDAVEMIALDAGNLAGVTIYEGTPSDWSARKVLPNREVDAGDYIVIHFRPEGIETEIDEVYRIDESGGKDSSPNAWDYWIDDGDGLSGNNGAVTISAHPKGEILDAVLYSNRRSDSDEAYRGFGSSRFLNQAEELVDAGAWLPADQIVRPEDAIAPTDSTATRSLCRLPGLDTNNRDDWYIVPTRGVSYGEPNELAVYTP